MALNMQFTDPAPRPNPVGQALQQAAASVGQGYVNAQTIQSERDQKLVSMVMQFLPNLIENPEALANFTKNSEFGLIRGALGRTGLGSIFSYNPTSGGYDINIPRRGPQNLEDMIIRAVEAGDMERANELTALKAAGSPSMYGYLNPEAAAEAARQKAEATERGKRDAANAAPTANELATADNANASAAKKRLDLSQSDPRVVAVMNQLRKTKPSPKGYAESRYKKWLFGTPYGSDKDPMTGKYFGIRPRGYQNRMEELLDRNPQAIPRRRMSEVDRALRPRRGRVADALGS